MPPIRSDRYLKTLFNDINQRFYRWTLPEETIVRWASRAEMLRAVGGRSKHPCLGLFGYEMVGDRELPVIRIYDLLRKKGWGSVTKETLLHEIAHLEGKGRDDHGPAFDKRMLRLARLGAFSHVW